MSYEVRSNVERSASFARCEALLHSVRSGPGPHLTSLDEFDARMDQIVAFDLRQAEAGDLIAARRVQGYRHENERARVTGSSVVPFPGLLRTVAARALDPRDATLAAMRADATGRR